MSHPKVVAYLASGLAGAFVAATAALLGAPAWATFGIGYLAFAAYRLDDRLKGDR